MLWKHTSRKEKTERSIAVLILIRNVISNKMNDLCYCGHSFNLWYWHTPKKKICLWFHWRDGRFILIRRIPWRILRGQQQNTINWAYESKVIETCCPCSHIQSERLHSISIFILCAERFILSKIVTKVKRTRWDFHSMAGKWIVMWGNMDIQRGLMWCLKYSMLDQVAPRHLSGMFQR